MPEHIGKLPKKIYAQASPLSVGGSSLFAQESPLTLDRVQDFYSEQKIIDKAKTKLQEAGFQVLQVTESTINFSGSATAFEDAFHTQIRRTEKANPQVTGSPTITYLEADQQDNPGLISTANTSFEECLEGVVLEEPCFMMGDVSHYAPLKTYWHLRFPNDVALGCNAASVHQSGITGKGIRIAMVDSGFYHHPFYQSNGYAIPEVHLAPGAENRETDESGHGTGYAANILAIAPGATFIPIKSPTAGSLNQVMINATGAFNKAIEHQPHIVSCGWGFPAENPPLHHLLRVMEAAILNAIKKGITVVCAAGDGSFYFPGQMKEVICVGGAYLNENRQWEASDYAAAYESRIFENRQVPDVCGLVGKLPKAIYTFLPVPPKSVMDSRPHNKPEGHQGGTYPDGDETPNDIGWAGYGGTSGSTGQVSGTAALMLEANPDLKHEQIKELIMSTCQDVTQGNASPKTGGAQAGVGPDLATGKGMINASRAVEAAIAQIQIQQGQVVGQEMDQILQDVQLINPAPTGGHITEEPGPN